MYQYGLIFLFYSYLLMDWSRVRIFNFSRGGGKSGTTLSDLDTWNWIRKEDECRLHNIVQKYGKVGRRRGRQRMFII
jgi:hypothetical protein